MHVFDVAVSVLNSPSGSEKVERTLAALELLDRGLLELPGNPSTSESQPRSDVLPPDRPPRDPGLEYVPPHLVPRRGKCGTLASRVKHLHALVHIEATAVDLAWDIVARFGQHEAYRDVLPAEFYKEFVVVAADEARHYAALKARLEDLGGRYGDNVVHEGLWDSARRTKDRLEARLAVEHATHEARGLDVLPCTIQKFKKAGDVETANLLEGVIMPEEVSHCAAGVKWIKFLFAAAKGEAYADRPWARDARRFEGLGVECWFHSLVRENFDGALKPPFNKDAREKAGFSEAWYLPLVDAPSGRDEWMNGYND
mmetsp:Transcript_11710/g.33060  ORF Transcript_11710/g.33060 Transcript_11710/m.33060 type:complete len:313 (-) Transcript_11710:290-1228(-)